MTEREAERERSLEKYLDTFDGPQSAWLEWEKPAELLWTLFEAGVNRRKVLACLVEIIERVVPIYEKKFPDDTCIRDAVEAVRRCSEEDSKENRDDAADAYVPAVAAARAADAASCAARAAAAGAAILASYATYATAYAAAARAADAASYAAHTAADIDAASCAADAASYAVDAAVRAACAATDIDTADYYVRAAAARESEREWQLKCIRRHFPVRPFLQGY